MKASTLASRLELEGYARDAEAQRQSVIDEIARLRATAGLLLEKLKRAMASMNERDARSVILEFEKLKLRAEQLDADAAVLRAMSEECREFLLKTIE